MTWKCWQLERQTPRELDRLRRKFGECGTAIVLGGPGLPPCSPVLPSEGLEPLQDVTSGNAVQSGVEGFLVAAEGFEPPTPRV